jgi:phosphoribosyl-AMP cyclohydrolase
MSTQWVVEADAAILERAHFSHEGLIPCIAQDVSTRAVLMMAWMDREALESHPRGGPGHLFQPVPAGVLAQG